MLCTHSVDLQTHLYRNPERLEEYEGKEIERKRREERIQTDTKKEKRKITT